MSRSLLEVTARFKEGPVIPGASVLVWAAADGTETPVVAYADVTSSTTVSNPQTTDSFGQARFYLPSGKYKWRITAAGADHTPEEWDAVSYDDVVGTPSGAAGGDLAGTYPNPTIKTALDDPVAATPGLRTLGTGATQAAAGTDSRLSDQRVPTDGSVTLTKLASGLLIPRSKIDTLQLVNADIDPAAAIAESKLALASDAAAGVASRRTLGTGAAQAMPGNTVLAKTFRESKPFLVSGAIALASAGTDYIPPFRVSLFAGNSLKLAMTKQKIRAGTSVPFKIQKNGADITGFGTTASPLTATTTWTTTDPTDVTLADDDELALVVTAAPTGSCDGLSVVLILERLV